MMFKRKLDVTVRIFLLYFKSRLSTSQFIFHVLICSYLPTGIGQTKDVRVYRLVTSRSFEQEMFDRASKKLGLEQAVLGTFEKEWDDDKPTQQEMEQLLKKGAYALLDDDNDEVTKQFCADDIDSILAKRTRTRVVEGTKSASWLNKQGMVVSKSKFTSETGETLDMDDPLFWQKVMPDFVTPSILLQKLRELEDEIEGRVRGPGRGKGRWKKKIATLDADQHDEKINGGEGSVVHETDHDDKNENLEMVVNDDNDAEPIANNEKSESHVNDDDDAEPNASEDEDGLSEEDEIVVTKLSQTNKRKVNKFLSDLKSMMESLFEDDDEEEALSSTEKDACQKLLLTVSVKGKIFTEEQRALAKKFLKRLEGDRRRRCRTSEQPRFQPGDTNDDPVVSIREELMITGKKKTKRKRKGAELDDELTPKKRKKSDNTGGYVGEDGYLHHSDSEDDWSDVGPDIYEPVTKKDIISRKDANRRRTWGAGDDSATAAGRAWPVFPRHLVKNVLNAVLDKVLKHDKQKGGLFSVPVPKEDFPEYYEQIKKPMDYGTMKAKLEDGEYRSAQSMQKDFVLIMQNCRTFNADSSDIVREARAQHLLRPKFLKEAAAEHNLFLAEDGSVLEIVDESNGSPKKKGPKKKNSQDTVGASAAEKAKTNKVRYHELFSIKSSDFSNTQPFVSYKAGSNY
jgi:Bromodomain